MPPRAVCHVAFLLLCFASVVVPGKSCTNVLVSAGASLDGSPLLAYNADSGSLYGSVGLFPAKTHTPNTTREVWSWDDAVFLGTIPEAETTYNVIGNANQFGLVIGETTFGGLPELDCHDSGGVMDYGSLIWITLQRCKTCDCAITTIDDLVQTHGYASDGESFSCVDTTSAWLMELIGKGAFEKGAVWVATRVPEGAVLAHANQARTSTFSMNDPSNVRFAADVVDFARRIGRFPENAPDAKFDFTNAYDPLTFGGARHGESRVWDVYRQLVGDAAMAPYLEYAKGKDLGKRMPLFVFPTAATATKNKRKDEPSSEPDKRETKLTVTQLIALMRSKMENSWFDTRGLHRADLGAGPGHSAYRARPLTWSDGDTEYANERTVSTQQTAWTFVAASRADLPAPVRAIQWWAPDDSGTSLRVPIYGGATRVPYHFADASGPDPGSAVQVGHAPRADALNPSMDSAFWVWNLVSSFAYGDRALESEKILTKELELHQHEALAKALAFEEKIVTSTADNSKGGIARGKALNTSAALLSSSLRDAEIAEAATVFVEETAEFYFHAWQNVFLKLFAHTRDGFSFARSATKKVCPPAPSKKARRASGSPGDEPGDELESRNPPGCTSRLVPDANEVGYDKSWRARIATDGDNREHYQVPKENNEEHQDWVQWKRARMEKRRPAETKARLLRVSANERSKVARV